MREKWYRGAVRDGNSRPTTWLTVHIEPSLCNTVSSAISFKTVSKIYLYARLQRLWLSDENADLTVQMTDFHIWPIKHIFSLSTLTATFGEVRVFCEQNGFWTMKMFCWSLSGMVDYSSEQAKFDWNCELVLEIVSATFAWFRTLLVPTIFTSTFEQIWLVSLISARGWHSKMKLP